METRGAFASCVNMTMIAGGLVLCVVLPVGCTRQSDDSATPQAPVQETTSRNQPPLSPPEARRAVVTASPESDAANVPPKPRIAADFVITLRNEKGSAVRFSKAEILAAAWGVVKRMELQTTHDRLTLSLEELRRILAANFSKEQKVGRVYLYIESTGYVPIRSGRFLWDGRPEYQERAHELAIGFPSGESVTVDRNGEYNFDLVLRWPEPRFVRLVDDDGRPVEGAVVESYMFWSSYNHCGALSGADWLGKGVSDREGRVRIADGDFEYALKINKRYYVVRDPDIYPDRFVGLLERREAIVPLHAMATRPLELWMTASGQPLANTVIMGRLAGYGCGADWGPLATTDEKGRVLLRSFRHEMYSSVLINDANGSTVWQADPRAWQGQEVVRVDLKDPILGGR